VTWPEACGSFVDVALLDTRGPDALMPGFHHQGPWIRPAGAQLDEGRTFIRLSRPGLPLGEVQILECEQVEAIRTMTCMRPWAIRLARVCHAPWIVLQHRLL